MPSRLGVESAEATVAVRLERTHAEFLSQGESLAVVGCGLRPCRGSAPCGNLAEEVQGIRFVPTLLVHR